MDRQIRYLDSLDPSTIRRNYDIIRTPTDGSHRRCVVISNLLTIVATHWVGRTQPCTWPNCQQCDKGEVPEIHSYIIVGNGKTFEKHLLELTAPPTAVLKEYQDKHGHVHGLGIELKRKNDKPNGPVHLTICTENLNLATFGLPPDMKPLLETLWRFNPDHKAAADAMQARRELARGEEPTPASPSLEVSAEKVSNAKVRPRKRS
jgi:hypothetical protein